GGFKDYPVEVFEVKYPALIRRYEFRPDTGGAGQFRGGCGLLRTFEVESSSSLYLWLERSVTPGWGLFGGGQAVGPHVGTNRRAGAAGGSARRWSARGGGAPGCPCSGSPGPRSRPVPSSPCSPAAGGGSARRSNGTPSECGPTCSTDTSVRTRRRGTTGWRWTTHWRSIALRPSVCGPARVTTCSGV